MKLPAPVRLLLRFGAYELDPQAGELYKHGTRMRLQDQPLKVLLLLVERRGLLVPREDFHELLWPEATAGDFDHGLNNAVNRLREVLCDSAEAPRFIETVPKRGYRFIAAVEIPTPEPLPMAAAPVVVARQVLAGGPPEASEPRPWPASATLLMVLALSIGTGVLAFRGWRGSPSASPAPVRAIAILPFENLTGDATQEYLADGMTDELTTELARIRSLRVISRTSAMQYKKQRKPLPEIARELKVDAVVEGSLMRSGSRIRVTTQLIDATTDQHLWAQSYERNLDEIVPLEAEIARSIAGEIRAKVTPEERTRLAEIRPVDPAAYQLYLQGRFFLAQRTEQSVNKAVSYFQQAIRKDPGYGPAHAHLAEAYALYDSGTFRARRPREVLALARASALKALELDPNLPEAYTVLAATSAEYAWDLTTAERYFRQAIAVGPGNATAHYWYARFLSGRGRQAEAFVEIERARSLDPLSLTINNDLVGIYFSLGRADQAWAQLNKTLEMDPNYPRTHISLGMAYEAQGHNDAAVLEYQKARALGGENWPELREPLQRAYEAGGVDGYYRTQYRLLREMSRTRYVSPVYLGLLADRFGDKEQALAWWEKAFQEREPGLIALKDGGGCPGTLQADARCQDLVGRIRVAVK
ncbi:MAG TPA: tetratricopeptide repeat protein [Terriglobales bacterium]|nr:tetratricopeptide repeat protein [Terriglobales bacterium]